MFAEISMLIISDLRLSPVRLFGNYPFREDEFVMVGLVAVDSDLPVQYLDRKAHGAGRKSPFWLTAWLKNSV